MGSPRPRKPYGASSEACGPLECCAPQPCSHKQKSSTLSHAKRIVGYLEPPEQLQALLSAPVACVQAKEKGPEVLASSFRFFLLSLCFYFFGCWCFKPRSSSGKGKEAWGWSGWRQEVASNPRKPQRTSLEVSGAPVEQTGLPRAGLHGRVAAKKTCPLCAPMPVWSFRSG